MSHPIQPYAGVSPHQAGIVLDAAGHWIWPADRPRRDRLAIYGAGGWRAMRRDGLFDSDEWVIFSLNNFWNVARDSGNRIRTDIWFEFHRITPDTAGSEAWLKIQDRYDMEWLRTCPVPIYTVEPFPENPNARVWPVEHYLNGRYRPYIACTFAVQLMMALEYGFSEVAVYGLAMLGGTQREATVEASCLAYWLGVLEGRGVKVTIPDHEDGEPQLLLRHPYIYGWEYWPERRWVERYLEHFCDRPTAI